MINSFMDELKFQIGQIYKNPNEKIESIDVSIGNSPFINLNQNDIIQSINETYPDIILNFSEDVNLIYQSAFIESNVNTSGGYVDDSSKIKQHKPKFE